MRFSRTLTLSLTMVVAIAWLGLSVGSSFHHHDHGLIHHDCPWCSIASSQLVLSEFSINDGANSPAATLLVFSYRNNYATTHFLDDLPPRAPPIS